VASGNLVEQLSGKPVELGLALTKGQSSCQASGCCCLTPCWCLSQWGGAPVVPEGNLQGLMGWSLRGGGPVIPPVAGAQEGLKGSGLGEGAGIPSSCGTSSRLWSGMDGWWGSWCSWIWWCGPGADILAWCGPGGWRLVQLRGRFPIGANLAWPKRWGSCCLWVWCGAVAWHSPRGGEPGRMEQWLCRPMGREFGRLAVLILDRGMEKPSTI
jgi:hypothetical protein